MIGLDPPGELPLVPCPACDGSGDVDCVDDDGEDHIASCLRCYGEGVDYLTADEVRELRAEAEHERSERDR